MTVTQREEEPGGIDKRLSAALQTTVSPIIDLEEWSRLNCKAAVVEGCTLRGLRQWPLVHGDAVRLDSKRCRSSRLRNECILIVEAVISHGAGNRRLMCVEGCVYYIGEAQSAESYADKCVCGADRRRKGSHSAIRLVAHNVWAERC